MTTTDAAIAEELEQIVMGELGRRFPTLKSLWAVCPVCNIDGDSMFSMYLDVIVIHLNDQHKWTREQIADFIEEEFGDIEEAPVDA